MFQNVNPYAVSLIEVTETNKVLGTTLESISPNASYKHTFYNGKYISGKKQSSINRRKEEIKIKTTVRQFLNN